MKKYVVLVLAVLVAGGMWTLVCPAQDSPKEIRMLCTARSGYLPENIQMVAKTFYHLSGIEVNIEYVRYADQYDRIREDASTYDVVTLDHIWLADFVAENLMAPLDSYFSKKVRADIEPVIRRAFQYDGKTWAFPFLLNLQMLFYHEEMLTKAGFEAPPATLEEMLEQMIALQEQGIITYPWSDAWKEGEGLICDFIWFTGAFGGKLFNRDGLPVFDQPAAVKALEFMVMLVKNQLADPRILEYDELAASTAFSSKQAAFTSNWFFQLGMKDPETGKRGSFALLPVSTGITEKTVTSGAFQGIGIVAASEKQDVAWKWIEFFTSPLVQRAFLFEMPVWTSVQTSQDANMLDPAMSTKRALLQEAISRPNIPGYQDISSVLQRYIHDALQGRLEPVDALSKAKTEVELIMKGVK